MVAESISTSGMAVACRLCCKCCDTVRKGGVVLWVTHILSGCVVLNVRKPNHLTYLSVLFVFYSVE